MTTFATAKEAEAVVGKLSNPSKMPGHAYGIPAKHCIVGSALAKVKGSVCASCYALKGRYVFPNVQAAQQRRFDSLRDPRWVDAMVFLISRSKDKFFRWHDSGDIQGLWHLENIVAVANRCPDVKFWMPTRENAMIREYLAKHGNFPPNLVVRVSSAMIGGQPLSSFPNTSTVVTDGSQTCPAYKQGGVCGDCRACWDPAVSNVSYPRH
jgi:hypothetical protein